MNSSDEKADAMLNANLTRIGDSVPMPPRADADRLARWHATGSPGTDEAPARGVRRMNRRIITLLASGALAAAIGLGIWFAFAGQTTASAAVLLDQVKHALGGKMSMQLAGIDLGNIVVSGEIVLDRDADRPDATRDRLYSELHVLMKADNRDWNDMDAVSVVCQTPQSAWRYCRGNGGSGAIDDLTGAKRVTPTDYFVPKGRWPDFEHDPLGDFGAMPLGLAFSSDGSAVHFRFTHEQRLFLNKIMGFLLTLGNPATSEPILAQLRVGLTDRRTSFNPTSDYMLTINDFSRFEMLQISVPTTPSVESIVQNEVREFEVDVDAGAILSSRGYNAKNESLAERGVSVDDSVLHNMTLPRGSLDGIVQSFKTICPQVEVVSSTGSTAKLRLTGCPLPTQTEGREWLSKTLPDLLRPMSLAIYYNGTAARVTKAEITHVGSNEGRIVIDMDNVVLDVSKTDPARWKTAERK